uniref:Amino acid transporter transmembrane domain-containing protein n=1 Tax=Setaria digitata TaxID=48799 RepID=A0A915PIJ6_9BILA
MLTTLVSVILIIIGSYLDYGKIHAASDTESITFESIIASLGTFLFGFGGHVVFPSIQHDMKHPKQFTRSAIVAFTAIGLLYLSVSLAGYTSYGNSLQDSVINSIQTGWIRKGSNLFIAAHCILTLTVIINPLNQAAENLVNAPHHFGWHRIIIRTVVLLAVLFVAETVPRFGPILNVIGGSTTSLTCAILPLIYNHYLNASIFDQGTNDYVRPTLMLVIQRNPKGKLLLDSFVIVVSLVLGIATTYRAVIDMASTEFAMPCYLTFLDNASRNSSGQIL